MPDVLTCIIPKGSQLLPSPQTAGKFTVGDANSLDDLTAIIWNTNPHACLTK